MVEDRRSYDIEITNLNNRVTDLTDQVAELNANVAGLVEAWQTAKGVTAFVKWISAVTIAIGILIAAIKGVKVS
jgi:hypothetical protein